MCAGLDSTNWASIKAQLKCCAIMDVEGLIADLGVVMEFHTGRLKTLHQLTLCKTIVSGVNRFDSFCSQIILQRVRFS